MGGVTNPMKNHSSVILPLLSIKLYLLIEQADAGRDGRARLARPNSQARTNRDKEKFIFPVQLGPRAKIDNLTQLIHTLL